MNEQRLSVVIPAFNEEKAIGQVIAELQATLKTSSWIHEIIVVDDGSLDATGAKAEASGARVVRHPRNMGYGGSLRTGILAASSEWIVTIDADCSYPPQELLKLLPFIPDFDMVVGARQGRHFWGNLFKHPARLLFLAMAEFVVGENIPDVNSGLRVFRKSVVLTMLPRLCRGFSFSTTMTLSFLSCHQFVRFVAIEYRSRVGSSKVRIFRDTLRTLQLLLETIIYYNPIKASLLLAGLPLLCGAVGLIFALSYSDRAWFFFASAMFGLVLLLISQGFLLYMLAHTFDHRRE